MIRNLFRNSTFLHNKTVIKREALHNAETLKLSNKNLIENLEMRERKVRNIIGPKFQVDEI